MPQPRATTVLHDTPHCRVTEDARRLVLWFTRAPTRPHDPMELLRDYQACIGRTGPKHRAYTAIIDSRAAIGRHDAAFERVAGLARAEFVRAFPQVVVLLKSMAGVLHAKRFQSKDGLPIVVAHSVEEALRVAEERAAEVASRAAETDGGGDG